jgi:RNA polymerase sigma-70 factor (ECF subfamily)
MEGLTDEEVAEITGLRSGTVRVRLHRARLFVRKELMKVEKPRPRGKIEAVTSRTVATEPSRPPRCKAMFAELSNYLDEQIDDSLCEELEKHLDGCDPCKAFLASLQSTIEIAPFACSPDLSKQRSAKDVMSATAGDGKRTE